MIFECAVALSGVITDKTGFKLSEHETAYIAMHIGSLLSTHLSVRHKVICVLLFPGYYDFGEKFTALLGESFGTSIIIQNVITHIEELQNLEEQIDLIISVVNIPLFNKIPFVCVNPFMIERDIEAIRAEIENVKLQKKKKSLLEQLLLISSPVLFARNKTFENKEAVIWYMADMMIRHGFVEDTFTDEVLSREHSFSTAYGNIAVPHSMKMNAKKTGMFVLLTDKPIPWGNNFVNIVLLFSISKESHNLFYDVFDNLVVLLLDPENAKKVMECDNYEDFITAIIGCL
jgi:lichenan operon transcriptional antiterminator